MMENQIKRKLRLEDHEAEYALIVHEELRKVDADLEALIHYAYSKFPGAIALIQPIQKELPSPTLAARGQVPLGDQ